jgi:hypothetical protein
VAVLEAAGFVKLSEVKPTPLQAVTTNNPRTTQLKSEKVLFFIYFSSYQMYDPSLDHTSDERF